MSTPVEICNMALQSLGHEGIRDFNKATKAERSCEVAYDVCLRQLLMYDWAFARKIATLRESADVDANEYGSPYDLPIDCKRPIDILPIGTRQSWTRIGNVIYTSVTNPQLLYTRSISISGEFPDYFVIALARAIEFEIAPAIKQSDRISTALERKAQTAFLEALDSDARAGSEYRHPDNDPNYDTFVDPDASEGTSFLEMWNGNSST